MKIKTTEVQDIENLQEEMRERRPLPLGITEFDKWAERIIKGAHISASEDSLKFSLASMIMSLGPTEAFKEDGYFILALRKAAANQIAHAVISLIKEKQEARKNTNADESMDKQAESIAPKPRVIDGILENQKV